MGGYRIRAVDGEDESDTLTELHRATFDPHEAPMANFGEGLWWIAYKRSLPVAFIGIEQCRYPTAGYFTRVGVDPEHRGHGLQNRLMRVMHAKARRVGWKQIITDTRDNLHSSNNIIGAGYRLFEPANPWGLTGTLYWKKDL